MTVSQPRESGTNSGDEIVAQFFSQRKFHQRGTLAVSSGVNVLHGKRRSFAVTVDETR
jgi:hypothetical protein